jgi:hypothetical protein
MKHILCPVGFSTTYQAAMLTAERLATALGAQIVLLHATGVANLAKEGLASDGVEACEKCMLTV